MADHYGTTPRKRKIVGMGEFRGGPPDLATKRKHLEDLGR
jgi:hypothetical protein